MVRYETYRANAVEAPLMRRWLLLGLVLSLALHAGLFYYLHQRQVEGFNLSIEQMKPAPVFHLKQVSIPEIPPDEQRLKLPEKMPAQAKLTLPSDKPVAGRNPRRPAGERTRQTGLQRETEDRSLRAGPPHQS